MRQPRPPRHLTARPVRAPAAVRRPKYLIVNADDFGYFPCVSQGIVDAVRAGAVTATSIMANRSGSEYQMGLLLASSGVDIGVHLNLTSGSPLTEAMRGRTRGEEFPSKSWWASRCFLGGRLLRDAGDELRTQIRKCFDAGVDVCFLNSHEHIHMLPRLFGMVLELVQEFGILFVRDSRPEWFFSYSPGSILRNSLLQGLLAVQYPRRRQMRVPRMFGMSVTGQLNLGYLRVLVGKLQAGVVGELMCHPGHCAASDVGNPRLRAYHARIG